MLLAMCQSVYASWYDDWNIPGPPCGMPDYGHSAQALADVGTWVMNIGGVTVILLYTVGAVLAIYSATTIYLKMMHGEEGFTKSVVMLVGSILFLISAVRVLPAFFGLGREVALW